MQIRKQYQEQKDRAIIKSFKDAGDLKGLDYYLVLTALLQAEAFVFSSDYGKKGIDNLTTAQRIKNQITDAGNLKEFCNYNLFTGYGNIADIDLDTKETRVLADAFLAPTGMEFGRASTPRSHRLYKIIDLTKKHGRKYFDFKADKKNAKDTMLVEVRAHKHYTMCFGQYENGEKTVWSKADDITEITYDALFKSVAMLAVAATVLKKYAPEGTRNEYWKLLIATMWYAKFSEADCTLIVETVTEAAKDDLKERLARVTDIYKRETDEQLQGLPTLAKQFNWTASEIADFKKMLLAVTGRHKLPEYTSTFVDRIVYMMKQDRYYDLEDKEMYPKEAINVKYAKDFDGKYTPLKFWQVHQDRKVAVDFTYKPATKSRFVYVEKKLMINIYEEHDLQPDPNVDTDIYDALVKHVIPHDDCRNHFLDWNAWILQNKGKKVRHGIILQSDEFQFGKGSLFDINRDILGRVNAKKIELEQALDKGKGYLINSIMCLIDEAKSTGKWEEKQKLINTLKIIISEGSVGIRQLYKEYSESDTCTNYWINTNHRDAFALPPNEVRYWVYFCEGKRNEMMLTEFHNARFNHNLAAGVYAKMLDRDVSKFKPNGVAPHTIYRDMMTKLADRPVNDYVRDKFEQGVFPFDRSMLTTVELLDWLQKEARVRVTRENDVANALRGIGGIRKKGCVVSGVGDNVNIWIIRDHETLKSLTAKELGSKYIGFWIDSKKN